MHDSRVIANRFLQLAGEAHKTLTPMQVLKLVYIAHGWMMALYGRPLIRDEVQAWQYGPVIPKVYNALREFGGSAVKGSIKVADEKLSGEEAALIDDVYRIYGNMTGIQLSSITHAKGTPWERTYHRGEFGTVMPNDMIEDHYRSLRAERS